MMTDTEYAKVDQVALPAECEEVYFAVADPMAEKLTLAGIDKNLQLTDQRLVSAISIVKWAAGIVGTLFVALFGE
jgi:hypothetical protein